MTDQIIIQPKSSHNGIIALIIIIIIALSFVLYYSLKDTAKDKTPANETNSTILKKQIFIKAIDKEGNPVDIDYELRLNNLMLSSGRLSKDVQEAYKDIYQNMTNISCFKDDVLYRQDNGSFVCFRKIEIKDLCSINNLIKDEEGCYYKVKNVSLCIEQTISKDEQKKRCYIDINYLCDGQVQGDYCFNISSFKEKNMLYLYAYSPDYYPNTAECSWMDESCIVRVDRKPDLNISFDNGKLIIDNRNDGLIKDVTMCFGWDYNTRLFDLPNVKRAIIPQEYQIYFDKCYIMEKDKLVYDISISKDTYSRMNMMLMGDFTEDRRIIRNSQNI